MHMSEQRPQPLLEIRRGPSGVDIVNGFFAIRFPRTANPASSSWEVRRPYASDIHCQPQGDGDNAGCREYRHVLHVYLFMKSRIPFFTLVLVALNIVAYVLELGAGGRATCDAYGLIPANFTRTGALEPLFTSLFLHDPDTLLHLGGNMAFLVVFGAIVEEAIGHLGFLALYLVAGASGGLMHVLVAPAAAPLVGASGAIFGVMAVAAVLRPRLLAFVVAFVGLNVWNAFNGGDGGVSFGAHIGGFVAGVLFVLMLRVAGSEALETA